MAPVGFEPTISAGERPQTHALDRAATGTGIYIHLRELNFPGSLQIKFLLIFMMSVTSTSSAIGSLDVTSYSNIHVLYRGADKSLARTRRKQATATEDFDFHISYL